MSNFADEQAVTDYYTERPDGDFAMDFDMTDGLENMTDEDWAEYDARNAAEVWPELADFTYDPDMMPGGTDFLSEPPF